MAAQQGGTPAAHQDIGSKQRGKSSNAAPAGVPFWGTAPDSYDTVTIAGIALPGICAVKGKGFEMRAQHKKVAGEHGETLVYLANEPAEWQVHILMTTEEHLRAFERLVPIFKPPHKPKAKASTSGDSNFALSFPGLPQVVQSDANVSLGLGQFGPTSYGGVREDPTDTTFTATTKGASSAGDKSAPAYVTIAHPLLALFRITHCRIMRVGLPEQMEDKGMWQVTLDCREHVLSGKKDASVGTPGASTADIAGMANAYADATKQRTQVAPSATSAGPRSFGTTGSY